MLQTTEDRSGGERIPVHNSARKAHGIQGQESLNSLDGSGIKSSLSKKKTVNDNGSGMTKIEQIFGAFSAKESGHKLERSQVNFKSAVDRLRKENLLPKIPVIEEVQNHPTLKSNMDRNSNSFQETPKVDLQILRCSVDKLHNSIKESRQRDQSIPSFSEIMKDNQSLFEKPKQQLVEAQTLIQEDPVQRFRQSNREFKPPSPDLEKDQMEQKLREIERDVEAKQRAMLEEQSVRRKLEEELQAKSRQMEEIIRRYESEKASILRSMADANSRIEDVVSSKDRHARLNEEMSRELKEKEDILSVLKVELDKSEMLRITTLSQLQELRGNLRIYCRLKPLPLHDERAVTLKDKACKEVNLQTDVSKKTKPTPYIFDYVFGETTTQPEVFKEIDPFIQGTLDGKSISIFAYGPTGSGKTHTLEGINDCIDKLSAQSGIMPRSLNLIIDHVNKKNCFLPENDKLVVHLSCLEIYNERIGDLLSCTEKDEEVQILMNKGKVVLPDIIRKPVSTMREALETIKQSSEKRQVEATVHNSHSSRSHSIYRITISKKSTGEELGLLNIIDMAGSEKNNFDNQKDQGSNSKKGQPVINSEKIKKIQKEANFINKSLTTLGRIIRLIKQQRTMGIKDMCIPYRESKLTRMLQDCIGGDAQTLMIVNINPSMKSAPQTKETLNFASMACV